MVYDPVGQKIAGGGEEDAEKLLTWLLGGITSDRLTAAEITVRSHRSVHTIRGHQGGA